MLLIVFLLIMQSVFPRTGNTWLSREAPYELIGKERSISLYERWIPNEKTGKVRELKAVFEVNVSRDEVLTLLKSKQWGTRWNTNAIEYSIFPLNANCWVTYVMYRIPFPFDNQDCCYVSNVNTTDSRCTEVNFKSVAHSRFPQKKGVTRITGIAGKWSLRETGNRKLHVTYIVSTDKSLNLPSWISDPIIHKNIFKTMAEFAKILQGQPGK